MSTHTIRCLMQACIGYEVKIIGDASMVAFVNPASGVNSAIRTRPAVCEGPGARSRVAIQYELPPLHHDDQKLMKTSHPYLVRTGEVVCD